MHSDELQVLNRGAACYLLCIGLKMVRADRTGRLHAYYFDNRDGAAYEALRDYLTGQAMVPALLYDNTLKALIAGRV